MLDVETDLSIDKEVTYLGSLGYQNSPLLLSNHPTNILRALNINTIHLMNKRKESVTVI